MSIGAPPEELALFGTLKVLVVDDSAEMRRLLLALLAAMNIGEVVCAQSGEAGLKLLAAERPDLLITDGAMQPMDGYEMTRRSRADTRPIHIVETQDYRGLSPARRLTPHMARE